MNPTARAFALRLAQLLSPAKPVLEFISAIECAAAAAWTSGAHRRQMRIQWLLPPQPESFDHWQDLYYQWRDSRNPQWVERGVFSGLALKNGDLLELCCGDGFNARNFYSLRSKRIVACDFEPRVIRLAKRKNSAPNVTFVTADIRSAMPEGTYENVVWDAAMEHFTEPEIHQILSHVKTRLTPDGILSGHTIVERPGGKKQLSHHEYEFKGKEDCFRFLAPYFKNVRVFETLYPERHNLYFWASDGAIPFAPEWERSFTRAGPVRGTA